ncbi:hypothetical protein EDB38_10480 [Vibrio crassostreae]|nr:hypothetical protein EDB56_102683 [Vibrio crassostreae]ROO63919.1 hypothetical protein EDB58_103462 [Vibrio crassostreae]ROO71267.1 hypothetical protein EDB57_1850 [Vibrio crassostreae]ROO73844.1 hypothetical protein EDB53_2566 [Vibrio crassostreae]ROR67919.1 hypothetical protein EDB59_1537 [Vibrio crassostreae]
MFMFNVPLLLFLIFMRYFLDPSCLRTATLDLAVNLSIL